MNRLSRLPIVPQRLISFHLASCITASLPKRCASSSSTTSAQDPKKAFSHTLLLPKTSFPLRQKNPVAAEKRYRARTTDELYRWQVKNNPGRPFILADGPPYANGNLHMGHALNKVLKDIINRYKVLRGYKVNYIPGWDCHGLPIEHKALAEIGTSHVDLQPSQIRTVARKTALEAIEIQKKEFRSLNIMADWDNHDATYRTLDNEFEIRQLKLFKKMVEKGYITHRLRPTYYSPSSRTALAEAELKYKDGQKSQSVYVSFPVEKTDMSKELQRVYEAACANLGRRVELGLAIWTTTAWSLPGNSGVSVHEDMRYVLASIDQGKLLVIAEERLEPMQEILGSLKVYGNLSGSDLCGTRYTHMFHPKSSSLPRPMIFPSSHVTSQSGTGLVHSAPAHGYEDYQAFAAAGILPSVLRCPIDDAGNFTKAVTEWSDTRGTERLVGKPVLGDGVPEIISLLREEGSLLAEQEIVHRYPCDWKTKEPIIVRATPQWFADVDAIKESAVKAMDSINFYPAKSRNRLEAFVLSRSEWCISRQRAWGVPIPALYTSSGEPLLSSDSLAHIISVLEEKGTDHWWTGPVEDFIPPSHTSEKLTKGTDTLDVWFDSGSSWTLLKDANLRPASEPLADVYLEGSDQHRGWFQSSLLTRLSDAEDGEAGSPYKKLITHGFVMDESGNKMSKSDGNGISPMAVIFGGKDTPAYGSDTLRLWAASVDYTRDVSIGPSSISHAAESLRKLRSTTRFILGNTTPEEGKQSKGIELSLIDRYILHELSELEKTVLESYESFAFNRVLQSITTFTSTTLSSFYFDTIKDTLYSDSIDSKARQGIVATLVHVLGSLMRMIAPIVPNLAEELYEASTLNPKSSVHLAYWDPNMTDLDQDVKSKMEILLALRTQVLSLIEEARTAKQIKNAAEAELVLDGSAEIVALLEKNSRSLPSLFGVSSVLIGKNDDPGAWSLSSTHETDTGSTSLTLQSTKGKQCPRCWLYTSKTPDNLCQRCESVVQKV